MLHTHSKHWMTLTVAELCMLQRYTVALWQQQQQRAVTAAPHRPNTNCRNTRPDRAVMENLQCVRERRISACKAESQPPQTYTFNYSNQSLCLFLLILECVCVKY